VIGDNPAVATGQCQQTRITFAADNRYKTNFVDLVTASGFEITRLQSTLKLFFNKWQTNSLKIEPQRHV
jgi:hypothetical protein